MKEKTYSKAIASAVNTFLTEDDWHFSFDENCGIFRFGLSLKGKLKKINYIVDIKDDEYLVYAVSPLGADEEDPQMMANMAEFISRANYGLKMGNFELDYNDGEVRFKVHVCCEDITPTVAMIKRSIYCPATMFDHYGSGIVNIIFNETTGKDAVEICEKCSESELRKMLAELFGDDESSKSADDDMETMIARIATRFGDTNTTDDNTSENDSDNIDEGEIHTDLFTKKGGVA